MLQQIIDELSLGEVTEFEPGENYLGIFKDDDKIQSLLLFGEFKSKYSEYLVFESAYINMESINNKIVFHKLNANYMSTFVSLFDDNSPDQIKITKNCGNKNFLISESNNMNDPGKIQGIQIPKIPILK